jgi:hypothetical protein
MACRGEGAAVALELQVGHCLWEGWMKRWK